jgi:hypothetical protein
MRYHHHDSNPETIGGRKQAHGRAKWLVLGDVERFAGRLLDNSGQKLDRTGLFDCVSPHGYCHCDEGIDTVPKWAVLMA